MKKWMALLLAASMLLALAGCGGSQKKLVEEKGEFSYEFESAGVDVQYTYTKTYDHETGEMTVEAETEDGDRQQTSGSFETDKNGRLTYEEVGYVEWSDSNGTDAFFFGECYYEYDDSGKLKRTEYKGEGYHEVCIYNQYGLIERSSQGSYTSEFEYEVLDYDSNGNPCLMAVYSTYTFEYSDGKEDISNASYEYEVQFDSDGRLLGYSHYAYDSYGVLLGYDEYTYRYDEDGNLTRRTLEQNTSYVDGHVRSIVSKYTYE